MASALGRDGENASRLLPAKVGVANVASKRTMIDDDNAHRDSCGERGSTQLYGSATSGPRRVPCLEVTPSTWRQTT